MRTYVVAGSLVIVEKLALVWQLGDFQLQLAIVVIIRSWTPCALVQVRVRLIGVCADLEARHLRNSSSLADIDAPCAWTQTRACMHVRIRECTDGPWDINQPSPAWMDFGASISLA